MTFESDDKIIELYIHSFLVTSGSLFLYEGFLLTEEVEAPLRMVCQLLAVAASLAADHRSSWHMGLNSGSTWAQ